jgi:hypothetical protein
VSVPGEWQLSSTTNAWNAAIPLRLQILGPITTTCQTLYVESGTTTAEAAFIEQVGGCPRSGGGLIPVILYAKGGLFHPHLHKYEL